MLRGRTLNGAALVLALALLWTSPAAANQVIGGACTTGQADGVQTTDGNNVVCLSSVWQYPAYQFGTSTATCNSTNKGITRYNSGVLQYCDSSAWQTLSSSGNGAMILISTQTANNSATLQWTGLSTYNIYKLYCYGLRPVNDANTLRAQLGTGAGPTWTTTNYNGRVDTAVTGSGALAEYAVSNNGIDLSNTDISNLAGAPGYIDATLYNFPSTTLNKEVLFHNSYRPTASGAETVIGETYDYGDGSTAVTAIKLYYTSGNISSGTCSLYGVNDGGGGAVGGGAGSVPLSALTAALSGANFDNSAYAQTWTWNSLTTGTGLTLSSSSLTSGNVMSVSTNSASSSAAAGYFASTGASNTGYALQALNNSTSGWGVYSSGTSPNYFAGSVGIGTTSPWYTLDVRTGTDQRFFVRAASYLGTGVDIVVANDANNATEGLSINATQLYIANPVTINTTTEVGELTVNGDIDLAASAYINFGATDGTGGYGFRDSAGTMQRKNSGGSWATISVASDQRVKRDVVTLPKDDGLAAIMKLRPVLFHWKDVEKDKEEGAQVGLIAQEVEKVFPAGGITYNFGNVAMTLRDGKKETVEHARGMNYEKLVAPLIEGMQEQQAEIEELRAEVAALKARPGKN